MKKPLYRVTGIKRRDRMDEPLYRIQREASEDTHWRWFWMLLAFWKWKLWGRGRING
jgi:hypothetical protein